VSHDAVSFSVSASVMLRLVYEPFPRVSSHALLLENGPSYVQNHVYKICGIVATWALRSEN
jgi:hypothetical protein